MHVARSTTLPRLSESALRRAASSQMLARYAAELGAGPLRPDVVPLGDVSGVHVAGISPDQHLHVATCARVLALGTDELPEVAREVFTLSLLRSVRPTARVVLLFAGRQARDSARAWMTGGAGIPAGIYFEVVDLPAEWTRSLAEAQRAGGAQRRAC